jgi:hypothetical protein
VSVSEEYERADGQIALHVVGGDLDFQAEPIPVKVAPAPARLALASVPSPVTLLTGRPTTLSLPLRNAGGVAASSAVAELTLPAGVGLLGGQDERWVCEPSSALASEAPQVVRCVLTPSLAARESVRLELQLVADAPDEVDGRSFALSLSPSGRVAPSPVSLPFTVAVPARLALSAPDGVEVLGGHEVPVELAVRDTGDLDAGPVTVAATAPEGTSWSDAASDGWACAVGGASITCTRDGLAAGRTAPLTLGLRAAVGSVGTLGELGISATADDADDAKPVVVPVVGRAPVLSVSEAAAHLLDGGEVQVELAVGVGDGADAGNVVATAALPANLRYARSDASSPGCAPVDGGRVVECVLGDVPAGDSAAVLFHARLRWSDPAARVSIVVRSGDVQSEALSVAVPATSGGLSARFIGSGMAVTEVGAPLLSCNEGSNACRNVLVYGSADNNGITMDPLDEAPPPSRAHRPDVRVSSSATLGPLKGDVAFAGLYWAANKVEGDTWSADRASVLLRGPGGAYKSVRGDVLVSTSDNARRQYYQSFADVTKLVDKHGAGVWSLADAAVAMGRADTDPTYFAGWALVVVYADGSKSDVSVYDGGAWVGSGEKAPVFSFAGAAGTTARVGVAAWEGDYNARGDALTLSSPLCDAPSTALTPVRPGGAFGSSSNAFDSTATGWRYANSLGTDAKGFKPVRLACDVSSLTPTTTGDQYLVGAITLRTEPPPEPTSDLPGEQS